MCELIRDKTPHISLFACTLIGRTYTGQGAGRGSKEIRKATQGADDTEGKEMRRLLQVKAWIQNT